MYAHTQAYICASQGRCKAAHNYRVCETPKYIPGNYLSADNPPMRADQRTTDDVASQGYQKLQLRATVSIKIKEVHEKAIVIHDNEIFDTIFIGRVTHTSTTTITASNPATLQRRAKPLPRHHDNSAQGETKDVVDHYV